MNTRKHARLTYARRLEKVRQASGQVESLKGGRGPHIAKRPRPYSGDERCAQGRQRRLARITSPVDEVEAISVKGDVRQADQLARFELVPDQNVAADAHALSCDHRLDGVQLLPEKE